MLPRQPCDALEPKSSTRGRWEGSHKDTSSTWFSYIFVLHSRFTDPSEAPRPAHSQIWWIQPKASPDSFETPKAASIKATENG